MNSLSPESFAKNPIIRRAIVVSMFPDSFMNESILPKLRKRVEVLEVIQTTSAASVLAGMLDKHRPDAVLHMVEMGGHSASETLSRICRNAKVQVRALSRKEATWSFLPPAEVEVPPAVESMVVPRENPDWKALGNAGIGAEIKAMREKAGFSAAQIAGALGCHRNTIWNWEAGLYRPSSVKGAVLLSAFRLPADHRGFVAALKEMDMEGMTATIGDQMKAKGLDISLPNVVPSEVPKPARVRRKVKTPTPDDEAAKILKLYEDEIAILKKERDGARLDAKRHLEAFVEAKKRIEDLVSELQCARDARLTERRDSDGRFEKVESLVNAAGTLLEAKLLTHEEFAQKVIAIVKSGG